MKEEGDITDFVILSALLSSIISILSEGVAWGLSKSAYAKSDSELKIKLQVTIYNNDHKRWKKDMSKMINKMGLRQGLAIQIARVTHIDARFICTHYIQTNVSGMDVVLVIPTTGITFFIFIFLLSFFQNCFFCFVFCFLVCFKWVCFELTQSNS